MERALPPFRADHIGSLIRPQSLIEARRDFMAGKLAKDALRLLEDDAIRGVVKLQEEVGFHAITDGEFRRVSYLTEFLNPIGVELQSHKSPDLVYHDDAGRTAPATLALVNRRISWSGSVNVAGFDFLKALTRETPKVTIPAPTQVHLFASRDGISRAVYPDIAVFWDDMVAAYAAELQALGAAGCRYVQLDETSIPKLADPAIQAVVTGRGQDWRQVLHTYIDVMNRIIRSAPKDMVVAVHHCRGNNAGMWQSQAGYEAVAELMFSTMEAKSYLLEFDTPRAGDFTPLRFMPKDKVALLGLISTKDNRIESADELKRRIDEAAKVMPLDRLCLGPQCGFSCGFAGSPLTYDSQVRKMQRIAEVARAVWNA
ncbi:MAG TPA: 5-methyltetrahydropteroyltriglutamate--homocysteine S-methyltransferase [Stellaceae bacterium]|nr:5-methyltetrahydropteroyltriglutamate--homocysteine S-methyltransferase [Stellaceae bacterium]